MSTIILGILYLGCVVGLGGLCIYLFYKKQFQFWKKYNVPHTTPRFPFGDIGAICLRRSPGEVIGSLHRKSKGKRFLGVWFWFTPTLMLRDPELIRSIFVRDFTHFHDRIPYLNVKKDPLSECSQDLVQLINKEIKKYEIVDMKEIAARFTTEVTIAYVLGVRSDCLQNSDAIFRKMGAEVFAPTIKNCFQALVPLLISRVGKLLGVTPTPGEVSEFFLQTFKEVMSIRESSQIKKDFLQVVMDLKMKGKIDIADRCPGSTKKEVNWNFTSNDAAAQAFIFFIAGFETSSLTIQYALFELATNQNIQDNVRKEVNEVLSKNNDQLTYDSLHEMVYLGKVLQETLRKYPVVPVVFRTCTKDYPIPDSDAVIPKGIQVLVSTFGLHRDPDIYPEPEKFDPERFSVEEKAKRHNYNYLPFGEGPRNCLGMRFSILQKKVALVSLLKHFKFELSSRTKLPHVFHPKSFFFAPKGGMPLKVTKL